MIYFTSDNHFCHSNIIGSCHRPFPNVNEMNEIMINNWNSLVTIKDVNDFYPVSIKQIINKIKEVKDENFTNFI